ncbi:MAG: PQQ-dependent sugar dehydrogenase [Caldilineaceae bacterium]
MKVTNRLIALLLLSVLLISACAQSPTTAPEDANSPADAVTADAPGDPTFDMTVLVEGLNSPWEIAYGPDDHLWVTERSGRRVLRVAAQSGQVSTAVTIDEVIFEDGMAGLQGMALHPELLQGTGNDYVYVAYSHNSADGPAVKIRRYTFDATSETLTDPVDIVNGLPAGTDHNGGRVLFGPDGKLYYSMGDLGANNLANYCLPSDAQTLPTADQVTAQDWRNYVGKVLRIDADGGIPADNPEWGGVRSHVFTVGHRNPQGLAAGNGQVYAAEHGPKTDDEVNRLVGGRNYGWPYVSGYQDSQAYVYAEWSDATVPCASLTFSDYEIPDEVPQQEESAWRDPSFAPPLYAFGTVETGYNFQNPACSRSYYICWPTIAPSGMDYYDASTSGIPGWSDSLLVAALKTGSIYRLPLSADGASVGDPIRLFNTTNRYRDLAISPNGRTFYVITDGGGNTQDDSGLPTNRVANPGRSWSLSMRAGD